MGDINLDKIPLEQIGPFAKISIGLLKKIPASARKRYGKRKSERLLSTVIMELLKVHPAIDATKAKLIAIRGTNSEPDLHLLRAESLLRKVEQYIPANIAVRKGAKLASLKDFLYQRSRGKYQEYLLVEKEKQ